MHEIERKFLVNSSDYKEEASGKSKVVQGYLNSDLERAVRVRIMAGEGFITVKGKSNVTGTTRFEWEKVIPVQEAEALLGLCEPGVIEKTRYKIRLGNHLFEVDEFSGDNAGLVVAEVELSSENEVFEKPAWLGEEVTGDKRFYNSYLSKNPYKTW